MLYAISGPIISQYSVWILWRRGYERYCADSSSDADSYWLWMPMVSECFGLLENRIAKIQDDVFWERRVTNMKKKMATILCVCFCLLFGGCNNEYAKTEYESLEKIASEGDRYSKNSSVFNPVEKGYRLTCSKFDGRETLWAQNLENAKIMKLDILLTLSGGEAKLVHVDNKGNVSTLLECDSNTESDDYISVSVTMPDGNNKLKLVGYDCKNLTCEFLFAKPPFELAEE